MPLLDCAFHAHLPLGSPGEKTNSRGEAES